MALELRHLRYVIAAAEHHSFRRAAGVLGVNQSAISRRIRDLEDELGASLFNRHSGGVELTFAGRSFLEHAKRGLVQIDCAASLVDAHGCGDAGNVRIGIFSSLSSGFIADLLHAFERRHTGVRLDFIEGAPTEHIASIRHHKLDVAFLTCTIAPPYCDSEHLWTEGIYVVVPVTDSLAGKAEIIWDDLYERHFIVSRSDPGPEIHDYLVKHLARLGHRASVEYCSVGRDNLMHLVSLGKGLTLTSEATTGTTFPKVTYRLLAGEQLPFCAIWSPQNDNPAMRRLLSLAKAMSKRNRQCESRANSAIVVSKALSRPSVPHGSASPSRNHGRSP